MADLLLHSLKEFDKIIFALLERTGPRGVLEIGSETGVFSRRLLDRAARTGTRLTTIEPQPAPELIEEARRSATFHLVVGYSLPFLEEHGCDAEFVLIDGDHNYFTVFNELCLIDRSWAANATPGTIVLHDVGFPCARRDCYYEPERIPASARHPHSYALGVTLDRPALISGGFRGAGHFAWAEREGGPRNGVLTAVEDFLSTRPRYRYRSIDAVFGLGVITVAGSAADAAAAEVLSPYDNALIRRLERNRLELYLRVLELQDQLAARRAV